MRCRALIGMLALGCTPGGDTGDTGADGFRLGIDVVGRVAGTGTYDPLAEASVRLVDVDGVAVERVTDADGHTAFTLDPATVPWDVTVAKQGYSATSLIDVAGPIEGAVHLSPWNPPEPPLRTITGAITGSPGNVVLDGPGVWSFTPAGTTYTAEIVDTGEALDILALDWTDVADVPNNAVWIRIDLSDPELASVDIPFPSTPRPLTTTSKTVTVPTGGALDASGFAIARPQDAFAVRYSGGFWHSVGRATPSFDGGTIDCTIESFGGDMAPTHLRLWLSGPFGEEVQVLAPLDAGGPFAVPEADALTALGTSLDAVTLDLRGTDFDHLGASAVNDGSAGGWFVYTYQSLPVNERPWPELPSGFSTADVGLHGAGFLHAFAVTYGDGVTPWAWTDARDRRVLATRADITY